MSSNERNEKEVFNLILNKGDKMKKITESFFELSNEDRCKILRSEKSGRLDYETLIEAQWFGDSDVRDLARELALKIPVEERGLESSEYEKFILEFLT